MSNFLEQGLNAKVTWEEVIEALKRLKNKQKVDGLDGFRMDHWATTLPASLNKGVCETVGCIAGTVCALAIEKGFLKGSLTEMCEEIAEQATKLLDITKCDAAVLFHAGCLPEGYSSPLVLVTEDDVISYLKEHVINRT